jgi:hypothetical protein
MGFYVSASAKERFLGASGFGEGIFISYIPPF